MTRTVTIPAELGSVGLDPFRSAKPFQLLEFTNNFLDGAVVLIVEFFDTPMSIPKGPSGHLHRLNRKNNICPASHFERGPSRSTLGLNIEYWMMPPLTPILKRGTEFIEMIPVFGAEERKTIEKSRYGGQRFSEADKHVLRALWCIRIAIEGVPYALNQISHYFDTEVVRVFCRCFCHDYRLRRQSSSRGASILAVMGCDGRPASPPLRRIIARTGVVVQLASNRLWSKA
jgi:hypothetical protein